MLVALFQRLLAVPPEEPLLTEIRAGGALFRNVVFTRNRRVMISIGDGGRTLRLHETFREAPAGVLRAVGRILSPGPKQRRDAARAVIIRFLRENPPTAQHGRRHRPEDHGELERLTAEFDRVNAAFFAGSLPRVPISLSGRMKRRNGHFSTHPVEIVISRALCTNAEPGEAENTLRHEMIHLWQHQEGRSLGHGRDFRRWAEKLGIHPRATRNVAWRCETG